MKSLVSSVFLSAFAIAQAGPSQPARPPVCPLSESQTKKSIDAFARIADFLTNEKRCSNCHGGVNPYLEGIGADPGDPSAPVSVVEHGGGKVPREGAKSADGQPIIDSGCNECHSNMPPRTRDGSPSRWMTAPGFLAFVGKDATALCKQIKGASRDADDFIGHLTDDNGGNNFGGAAFNGDRGLDRSMYPESEVPTQKPRISHAALLKMGHEWVDAMGGEFKGDRECGCVPSHYLLRFSGTLVIHDEDTQYRSEMLPMDIPLTFEDDGAFHGEAGADFRGSGVAADCAVQAGSNSKYSISGKAIETGKEHSMRLTLKTNSPVNGSGNYRCPDASGSFAKEVGGKGEWPFEMRGEVGEALSTPLPSPAPEITSTGRIEVVKKE